MKIYFRKSPNVARCDCEISRVPAYVALDCSQGPGSLRSCSGSKQGHSAHQRAVDDFLGARSLLELFQNLLSFRLHMGHFGKKAVKSSGEP